MDDDSTQVAAGNSSPVTPVPRDRAGPPDGEPARRLPSLTGLRFAAAFGVFGFHYAPYLAGTAHSVLGAVFVHADSGVSFFFILSGAVLTWSHRPTDTPRPFYRRRFARIYPDYLAAWILTIGVIAYEGRGFVLRAGALGLVLLQSWYPKLYIAQGWNGVSWTLSCEAFFYLCFPLLLRKVEALRRPAILVPFLCLPTLVLGLVGLVGYRHTDPQTLLWLADVFPPVRMGEFVIGIVLAVELRRGGLPRVRLWQAGVLLLGVYALVCWSALYWMAEPLLIPFLALVILAAGQGDLARRPSLWSRRPLVALGERSYAFYLLHQLVIRVWAKAYARHLRLATLGPAAVWFVLLALASVGGAAALFGAVEVPSERRLRGSPPRLELSGSP